MKMVAFWVLLIAGMLFMAAFDGADLPKWVWIFIACVFAIYALGKETFEKWWSGDDEK